MPVGQAVADRRTDEGVFVLGVDTCGPSGSVALALIEGEKAEILGQKELAGRTYSATLVATIAEILEEIRLKLRDLSAIVVVNGPGSFTGVRVGLSAVKGLAEPAQIPVVPVSRLAVMAARAGVGAAALDAHRHELFLRIAGPDGSARELLAGAEELAALRQLGTYPSQVSESRPGAPSDLLIGAEDLAAIATPAGAIAVCEEAAEALLKQAWPEVNLVRTNPPTAADAIELCIPRILGGDFADLALLDGHYLRRSDAEIFGAPANAPGPSGKEIRVRRMEPGDLDRVVEIARAIHHAPDWPRNAYEKALDPEGRPRRIGLIAEEVQSGALVGFAITSLIPPEAELETIVTALAHQRRGVARDLFSSLKNELRHQEVREIVLEVRAGNKAAQGFYRFLGFSEQGRRTGYYADPVEDAIQMRLPIA